MNGDVSGEGPPRGANSSPSGGSERSERGGPPNPGAKLIAPAHPIDSGALAIWLRAHVDPAIDDLVVEQYQGGQSNPTYRLTSGDRRYVLRRKPPGKLLASAHAVDREYHVMSALGTTGFPVPRTWGLCDDDTVIGTMFFVMDCVDGRVLWDQQLPDLPPEARAAVFDAMNATIAHLHEID